MSGEVSGGSTSEMSIRLAETKETKNQNAENFRKIKPKEGTTVKDADSFWKQEFSKEAGASKGSEKSYESLELGEKLKPSVDIEKLQNKYIKIAEETPDLNNLDSQAKGNYAEMKVDRDLAGKGYERISKECVTDLSTATGPGIDGVYVNRETGKTYIIETKFNRSELGNTLDGKQMSSSWIDNRLDAAVGKEKADEIRMDSILNPDRVEAVLAKVGLNEEVSYYKLDSDANVIGGIEL